MALRLVENESGFMSGMWRMLLGERFPGRGEGNLSRLPGDWPAAAAGPTWRIPVLVNTARAWTCCFRVRLAAFLAPGDAR